MSSQQFEQLCFFYGSPSAVSITKNVTVHTVTARRGSRDGDPKEHQPLQLQGPAPRQCR